MLPPAGLIALCLHLGGDQDIQGAKPVLFTGRHCVCPANLPSMKGLFLQILGELLGDDLQLSAPSVTASSAESHLAQGHVPCVVPIQ